MRTGLIQGTTELIDKELKAANEKFRAFASTHEGYAVTLEEAQEAETELRKVANGLNELCIITKNNADKDTFAEVLDKLERHAVNLAAEAMQTAAMIRKFKVFNEGREA